MCIIVQSPLKSFLFGSGRLLHGRQTCRLRSNLFHGNPYPIFWLGLTTDQSRSGHIIHMGIIRVGIKAYPTGQLRQHDAQLLSCLSHAGASAASAAKRKELPGAGFAAAIQPAFGAKLMGIFPKNILTPLRQIHARSNTGACGNKPLAEVRIFGEPACGSRCRGR